MLNVGGLMQLPVDTEGQGISQITQNKQVFKHSLCWGNVDHQKAGKSVKFWNEIYDLLMRPHLKLSNQKKEVWNK